MMTHADSRLQIVDVTVPHVMKKVAAQKLIPQEHSQHSTLEVVVDMFHIASMIYDLS